MRALARWGITPLLAAPVGAWALGLGNIDLKSALNQPFQAQIEVVSATPDELLGLKVALAPSEMFERYGLDRPAFLQNLEFRVVSDRSGRGVVQVTSAQSITEPFVTLLVEATWPRGRVTGTPKSSSAGRGASGAGSSAGVEVWSVTVTGSRR